MTGKRFLYGRAAVFFLLLCTLTGCRRVEFAGIDRVAVLALDNRTSCQELGSEIKRELLRALPSRLAVEVVDGVAVEAELPPDGVEEALAWPGRAAELGARYGVDAFLVGTVTDYQEEAEERLGLQVGSEEGVRAEIRVDLKVTVGFNLKLIRAVDGTALFSRYATGSATHPLIR
ncbi:MAG: hypothetical protein ACUVRM_12170 [Bacillota bacterium]